MEIVIGRHPTNVEVHVAILLGWMQVSGNEIEPLPLRKFTNTRVPSSRAEAPDPYHAITVDAVSLLTRTRILYYLPGPVTEGGRGGLIRC